MLRVSKRRLGREMVLQALYAYEFTKAPPHRVISDLKRFNTVDADIEEFVTRLFTATTTHQEWVKKEITRRLKNWDYDRVALIDRLILQMMMVEMVYLEDVPLKVSITEGVEIAKKYSTEDSGAFVNGILDSFYHSLNELSQPVD